MHLSISEIDSNLVKAVLGAGLPLGLGEEAGRAARDLAGQGVDGLAAFADALDALDSGRSTGFQIDPAMEGAFLPAEEGLSLSALRAGPSACDLLVAGARSGKSHAAIALTAVDAPMVILSQALVASSEIETAIVVRWRDLEGLCQAGRLKITGGGLEDCLAAGPADLAMTLSEPKESVPEAASDALANGLSVDAETWRRIYAYANRQLVPATEASRLTGAGAGLTDND